MQRGFVITLLASWNSASERACRSAIPANADAGFSVVSVVPRCDCADAALPAMTMSDVWMSATRQGFGMAHNAGVASPRAIMGMCDSLPAVALPLENNNTSDRH